MKTKESKGRMQGVVSTLWACKNQYCSHEGGLVSWWEAWCLQTEKRYARTDQSSLHSSFVPLCGVELRKALTLRDCSHYQAPNLNITKQQGTSSNVGKKKNISSSFAEGLHHVWKHSSLGYKFYVPLSNHKAWNSRYIEMHNLLSLLWISL